MGSGLLWASWVLPEAESAFMGTDVSLQILIPRFRVRFEACAPCHSLGEAVASGGGHCPAAGRAAGGDQLAAAEGRAVRNQWQSCFGLHRGQRSTVAQRNVPGVCRLLLSSFLYPDGATVGQPMLLGMRTKGNLFEHNLLLASDHHMIDAQSVSLY